MKISKPIAAVTHIFICFLFVLMSIVLSGCNVNNEYESETAIYRVQTDSRTYGVFTLTEKGRSEEIIYIPYELNGRLVTDIGSVNFLVPVGRNDSIYSDKLERIYLPYTVYRGCKIDPFGNDVLVFISNTNLVFNIDCGIQIIPNLTYLKASNGDGIVRYKVASKESYTIDLEELEKYFIPANISYMFNYADCPNEGYYSIDLITETGKLTPQPYEPPREGYTFGGWYKESECINKWNFETDEVIISFDEEGNRIYEEIKLYAKWIEN